MPRLSRHLRSIVLRAFIALVPLAMLSGCLGWSYSWHERWTVTVETPSGPRTGSTVRRVRWNISELPGDLGGTKSRVEGEAVVVDVRPNAAPGEPRYLFVLHGTGGAAQFAVLDSSFLRRSSYKRARAIRRAKGEGAFPLPRDAWPRMVAFGDVADPMSVVRIALPKGGQGEAKPGSWRSREPSMTLEQAFGTSVRVADVTIEIVGGPRTDGITDAVLRWLQEYYERSLDGRETITIYAENWVANSLGSGSFDTEKK